MSNPNNKLSVIKILDYSFKINEELHDAVSLVKYSFDQHSGYNLEKSYFNFVLITSFFYEGKEDSFMSIEVQNIFHVPNLDSFVTENPDETNFTGDILFTIVGLSISHSRALLAKNSRGTMYQDILIPIVNPIDVAKKLFSEEYKQKETIKTENIKEENPVT